MQTQTTPSTAAEKLAQIVALLKDERGEWREDVNGADFVQEVSIIIDAPTVAGPVISDTAQKEDAPWCAWTLAFADGSDWETAASYGFAQLRQINFRLTTADGRSRPVSLRDSAVQIGEHESGIEVTEIDNKDYEPFTPERREKVRYEDIREIVVF